MTVSVAFVLLYPNLFKYYVWSRQTFQVQRTGSKPNSAFDYLVQYKIAYMDHCQAMVHVYI